MLARLRKLAPSLVSIVLFACSSKDSSSTAPAKGNAAPPAVVVTSVVPSTRFPTLYVGASTQATVVVTDQNGNSIAGADVTWNTSASSIATVSNGGLITGVAIGNATISATSGSKTGTVAIVVSLVPIARIVVSPSTLTVQPWQSGSLSAVAYDSAGNQLSGRSFSWLSSDTVRAPVSSQGAVTANLLGAFTVTASSGGISGNATVTVAPATSVMVGPNISMSPNTAASEMSVAINPINPLNIAASSNWNHFYSFDGGRTWARTDVEGDGQPQGDPNISFDRHGILYRQGLDVYHGGQLNSPQAPRGVTVQPSIDGGRTLSPPAYAYKPPAFTGSPDQGSLTIQTVSTSPYVGSLYVTAADYQSAGYLPSYPAVGFPMIALVSRDGGKTWAPPIDISDSPINSQENSEYVTTGEKGQVYAAWVKIPDPGTVTQHVVFTRSLDGGKTWSPNSVIHTLPQSSNPYGTDIRGNITIDVDRSNGPNRGTIYLSSIDYDGPTGGASDAWMMKSTDGGNSWSSPVLLSDAPRGPNKYDFQPRISVAPNGRVDAAWYGITGWDGTGTPSYDVYYSYSMNGGQSFSPSIRVTTAPSLKVLTVFGEYMGLTADSTRTMVTWTDLRTGTYQPNFSIIWHAATTSSQSVRRTTTPAIKKP